MCPRCWCTHCSGPCVGTPSWVLDRRWETSSVASPLSPCHQTPTFPSLTLRWVSFQFHVQNRLCVWWLAILGSHQVFLTHWSWNKMATLSNGIIGTLIKIWLKYVSEGAIDNMSALVQIMAWRRTGKKPLPEPIMTQFAYAYMYCPASVS